VKIIFKKIFHAGIFYVIKNIYLENYIFLSRDIKPTSRFPGVFFPEVNEFQEFSIVATLYTITA